MDKKYVAGKFSLKISKNQAELFYNDKSIVKGCDKVLDLLLTMSIGGETVLDGLDLEDESELDYLEKMLNMALLGDNNNFCIRK